MAMATAALPPSVMPVPIDRVTVPEEVPVLTIARSKVLPTLALPRAVSIAVAVGSV